MKIQVTQEDIALGEVGSRCYCPIARAMCRALSIPEINVITTPSDTLPDVRTEALAVDLAGETVYELPFECLSFIKDFDDHCRVEPFEFELPAGLPYDPEGAHASWAPMHWLT